MVNIANTLYLNGAQLAPFVRIDANANSSGADNDEEALGDVDQVDGSAALDVEYVGRRERVDMVRVDVARSGDHQVAPADRQLDDPVAELQLLERLPAHVHQRVRHDHLRRRNI